MKKKCRGHWKRALSYQQRSVYLHKCSRIRCIFAKRLTKRICCIFRCWFYGDIILCRLLYYWKVNNSGVTNSKSRERKKKTVEKKCSNSFYIAYMWQKGLIVLFEEACVVGVTFALILNLLRHCFRFSAFFWNNQFHSIYEREIYLTKTELEAYG